MKSRVGGESGGVHKFYADPGGEELAFSERGDGSLFSPRNRLYHLSHPLLERIRSVAQKVASFPGFGRERGYTEGNPIVVVAYTNTSQHWVTKQNS